MNKLQDNYNYHDWTRFMVREPKDNPQGPHFAAVLFDSHSECTGYKDDSNYRVPNVVYFAFPDQATLGEWVIRAVKDNKQFFFFEVKKLGNVELRVNVDLGV
jgi:hypothetical protein